MKDVIDYIIKNKYVIICVAIALILYALGVVEFLTKFVILVVLLGLAVFVGRKMQENEKDLAKFFGEFWNKLTALFSVKGAKGNEEVYYYQEEKKDKANK